MCVRLRQTKKSVALKKTTHAVRKCRPECSQKSRRTIQGEDSIPSIGENDRCALISSYRRHRVWSLGGNNGACRGQTSTTGYRCPGSSGTSYTQWCLFHYWSAWCRFRGPPHDIWHLMPFHLTFQCSMKTGWVECTFSSPWLLALIRFTFVVHYPGLCVEIIRCRIKAFIGRRRHWIYLPRMIRVGIGLPFYTFPPPHAVLDLTGMFTWVFKTRGTDSRHGLSFSERAY